MLTIRDLAARATKPVCLLAAAAGFATPALMAGGAGVAQARAVPLAQGFRETGCPEPLSLTGHVGDWGVQPCGLVWENRSVKVDDTIINLMSTSLKVCWYGDTSAGTTVASFCQHDRANHTVPPGSYTLNASHVHGGITWVDVYIVEGDGLRVSQRFARPHG